MKENKRICPVCGNIESASADYCRECGAKTIPFDGDIEKKDTPKPESPKQQKKDAPKRQKQDAHRKQEPDDSRQETKKGRYLILPLLAIGIIGAVALGKNIFKADGSEEDSKPKSTNTPAPTASPTSTSHAPAGMASQSAPVAPTSEPTPTPSVCEVSGHSWLDANYQQPRICSVCGETSGTALIPTFEAHGLSADMEEGVAYDYITACNQDRSKQTVGALTISDYRIFESDAQHPAEDGYEWRHVHISASFFDENANDYGVMLGPCWEDYYASKDVDDSAYTGSDGTTRNVINYYGVDYPDCTVSWENDAWGEWHDSTVEWEADVYALLPIGYDGCIIGFYDASTEWGDGMYIYDIADENSLFFRME